MELNRLSKFGIMQGRLYPHNINELQCFPQVNWQKEFTCSRNIGFDFIELLLDRDGSLVNPLWSHNEKSLSILTNENNYSVCADYFVTHSIGDLSEVKIRTVFEGIINTCCKLGSELIVLPLIEASEIKSGDQLKTLCKNLAELIKNAPSKTTIALETLLPAEMLLRNGVNLDIGICYDLGNAAYNGGDLVKDIELLNLSIKHIHIKDRSQSGENVKLGEGLVDFDKALLALKRIDYKENYTFETSPGNDPLIRAAENLDYLKKKLQKI
jgi:sugar phosphate isomerase/epimerase